MNLSTTFCLHMFSLSLSSQYDFFIASRIKLKHQGYGRIELVVSMIRVADDWKQNKTSAAENS